MRAVRRYFIRLTTSLTRRRFDERLSEELEQHVDQQTADNVRVGLPPDEARRQALLKLGGIEVTKERCYDQRGLPFLETLFADLRYGVRVMSRTPSFALAVIGVLALGIGANTAIFTLIDSVLLRSLPVSDPTSLQFVARYQPQFGPSPIYGYGYEEFRRLRAANLVFTDVAAYAMTRLNVSIDGRIEPTADGCLVSGSFFQLLGVRAIAGRTIGLADDQQPNGHPVAVISDSYWSRRFGRDRSIVGRTISLSGVPFTIVGVTPPEFFGLEVGRAADVFVPVMMQPAVMPEAENWLRPSLSRSYWLTIVGRLRPGVTPAQAADALSARDLLDELWTKPGRPGESPKLIAETLGITPAATGLSALRQQYSQPLVILMAIVAVVLLIACANVATLILARGGARSPEFSMRLALGAGRGRLIRQLLSENVVLAVAGGAAGLLLAQWGTSLLVAFMSAGRTPIVLNLAPDPRILAFTATVSILTGLLCGMIPAIRATRVDVIAGLKRRGRAQAGTGWVRPGKMLVVSQVALCVLLLFGAGLFVRSLWNTDVQDVGFNRDRVHIVRVEPRGSDQRGVPGASQRLDAIYRDLIQRVEAIPGVQSASLAHFAPTTPVAYGELLQLPSGQVTRIARMMTYPGYFDTMGIAMVAGRDLQDRDLAANAPEVMVVNQAFVRNYLNGEPALGKRFAYRERTREHPQGIESFREIVGVVKDSRYASLKGAPEPVIYQPFLQTNTGRGQMTLHVRTTGDDATVVSRIREEVQRIDRAMPLFPIQTLRALVDGMLGRERLVATLTTLFSLLALLLAAVGLYGLMAFSVVRRTNEMGIRMALGAGRTSVLRLVMSEALLLVVLGMAIGVPAALVAGQLAASQISGLIFGLTATDPVTMAGAVAVLMFVATVAAYFPAARASRVDPMIALRSE